MKTATLLGKQTRKHPELKLRDAAAEAREADKARNKNGINKRFTSFKTAEASTKEADEGSVEGIMVPTDEQLERINQFTRSPKTADELVVFRTLSANDIVDRDFDQFPTKTIQEFAALEQPFSSVGKSYMVGHDYSKLPIGRIFGVGTEKVSGANFLTNEVYIPNTKSNEALIENIDFGVNWAVSVGVMMGANECSICGSGMSSWFGFCYEKGHVKGYYYDPNSEEEDAWGFAEPVDPSDKNAKLAVGLMKEPRDFYELSQVFLGAQYFAALDEKSAIGGIVKEASALHVPFVGLSKSEAQELPIPRNPKQVDEAMELFTVETDAEGDSYWTDNEGLRWIFNAETSEVMCLGKVNTNDKEASDGSTDEERESGEPGADVAELGAGEQHDGSGSEEHSNDVSGEAVASDERSAGDEGVQDAEPEPVSEVAAAASGTDSEEEEDVDVDKLVRDAFAAAKAPADLLEGETATGSALLTAALSKLVSINKGLTTKAELGDAYLKSLRAEALDWYVKSHQAGAEEGVKTETFQRMLEVCGDDVELIKSLIEEEKDRARAKFPTSVRRSSFQDNPHDTDGPSALPDAEDASGESDKRVSRLHS